MSGRIRDAGKDDYIRWMLYAYPGHGKTSFISSGAAEGLKILLIRSPMDQIPKRALGTGMQEWIVSSWEDMLEVQEYAQHEGSKWDWIWEDCISVMQDVLLDDIWGATVAEKPHRDNLTPSGGLDRGEYGRNMERIKRHVRHMAGCRQFHYGITAHPFEAPHPANDEGGVVLQPYVQGKNMSQHICAIMNTVSFMEVKENEDQTKKWRRFYFAESERWYAKDQQDAFVEKGYADNLTLGKATAALTGTAPKRGRATTTRRTTRQRREQ